MLVNVGLRISMFGVLELMVKLISKSAVCVVAEKIGMYPCDFARAKTAIYFGPFFHLHISVLYLRYFSSAGS